MSARAFFAGCVAAGLAVVWPARPLILNGADSGCYARVAKELAERPLSQALELTLGHLPFFEHPPLGFWLESAVFRALGASAEVAVGLARLEGSAALLLLALVALRLARGRSGASDPSSPALPSRPEPLVVAGCAVLGALTLPGFLMQSQVPMLEMPLTVALAAGLSCLAVAADAGASARERRLALVGFAVAFAAAL